MSPSQEPFFDPDSSAMFIRVAVERRLIDDEQARTLLTQATAQSEPASRIAIESGVIKPIEAEIIDAFTDPESLAPGYRLLDVIGYGGLGVVYRAHQPQLQRDVAIKAILRDRLEQPNVVARFQQEGAAIARLRHPNIIHAIDSGTHRDRLYLVMELVEGSDMRRALENGPMEWTTAISLIRQTAAGLSHALAHQIIHRDIKPGNLILTEPSAGFDLPAGVPLLKIADFGLARLSTLSDAEKLDTRLTMAGSILGTPMYCAPEQLTGDETDHRADIYALGATLYHALTGRAPFQGLKTSKIMAAKIAGDLPSTDALPDQVPAEVGTLLHELMAHDPDERLSDYQVLIDRIDEIVGSPCERKSGVSRATRTPKAVGAADADAAISSARRSLRHRRWAIGLALGTLVALLGFAALKWTRVQSPGYQALMIPTGLETHLFDGRSVTDWMDREGLWSTGQDDEGGAVLVGAGAASRRLPTFPINPNVATGIGVRVGIDLQQADSAEVHFGFDSGPSDDSPRYAVRLTPESATLGRRSGQRGPFEAIGTGQSVASTSNEGPVYHEVRVELQGNRWFVFFDGNPLGDVPADSNATNDVIRLVAQDGKVFFEGLAAYQLQMPNQTSTSQDS